LVAIQYGRGGQTAAHEPRAALQTFACSSLSFSKNYIFLFFISIAKCRNIVKMVMW